MTDLLVGAPVTTERFEFYGCGIEVGSRDLQLIAPNDETVLAAGLAWERG